MLALQRRAVILDLLRRDGAVRVAHLVERLGVSDMTVRRDLEALARSGSVEKVHGGAVATSTATTGEEPGFEAKVNLESQAKAAVAAAAADLVKPGSVVAVSGGTTAFAVATRLRRTPGLTVVTNSLPVADLLRGYAEEPETGAPTVLLTGGAPTRSASLVGPLADQTIRSLRVDLLIMGAHGVSERAGVTSPNLAEAQTNRALIDSAARLAVVADHSKWGVVGLSRFAGLDEIDYFVSDDALDEDARSVLDREVGRLVLADRASV
ncbi:DeoR/GlpR family DNA-binding transcription regulator [Streptomyces roseolus]|uniref:DeoR/GlpR family DNA-binding transcription regulator n=1 Tax=Streptomyces roseolus TaxID=67358 RepID=UPI0019B043B9|nr:DeoR/GlpR family DNA-binding transcription regulator [Streptomyces roseolus]GGR69595.1 DeoR family transcriptional regulator [Streptomyces roseolus]